MRIKTFCVEMAQKVFAFMTLRQAPFHRSNFKSILVIEHRVIEHRAMTGGKK